MNAYLQLAFYLVVLIALAKPLGAFMADVYEGKRTFLTPVLGSLEPGTATVVVLMGLQTRALVAGRLLSRGWAPGTPAAVLLAAGTSDARTWRGTLAALGGCELPDLHPSLPGVLVIGASVAVAAQLEALGGPRLTEGGPMGAAAAD